MFVHDLIEGGLVLLQMLFLAFSRGHFPATTRTKSVDGEDTRQINTRSLSGSDRRSSAAAPALRHEFSRSDL